MIARLLTAAAAALTLAACATVRAPIVEDPPFTWTFEEVGGGQVVLYFGDEGTDNVGLGFRCAAGSRRAAFSSVMPDSFARGRKADETWKTSVRLSSGRVSRTYPGRGAIEGEFGPHVHGEADIREPVLTEFARTGRIVVNGYPQYGSSPADLAAIRRFMDACAGARDS